MNLRQQPSPNCNARRDGLRPSLIVLHYTAMTSCAAALERLCDPLAEVSAHYLIGRDGDVVQLVDETQRAWHAGKGTWGGQGDVNSRSVGIELDNDGASPFSEPLMAALEALLPGVMARWDIPASGVIGHSDMAPGRKSDPGRRFDWRRLARQDLSVWPDMVPGERADPQAFAAHAVAFGYPANLDHSVLLGAVRARFRPWADGPLDATDMGLIKDLVRRFAVDPRGPSA